MTEAYVYDHVRTPRGKGKADGSLHEVTAVNLSRATLVALKERNALDTSLVDDVILGCVDPVGEAGGDIARSVAVAAGYGAEVPGVQINRFCASGLDAVAFGAAQIMAGQKDLVVGGGVESMSRVGMGASGMMPAVDPSVAIPSYFSPQGVAADLIASKYGFSRDDVDAFAVESHKRAANAWEHGWFSKSVIPVKDVNGLTILGRDETIRPATNMQTLGSLKASFAMMGEQGGFDAVAIQGHPEVESINHVHHAGNSSGIVDGAAAVLIGNKQIGEQSGMKPRARIRGFASLGSDLALVLTGPVDVTEKLLKRTGMSIKDIDLIEINEAFSAVVLRYLQAFDLDPEKVNVNGGAIAMGHPLGATGAMILGTVIDELERRDLNVGLVTLCVAHGMGTAMIVERV
ncbi:MAG: acetyl-CoA C-acetyltransferase [Beijerinckiaceae bacterium]|nr:acetyl-CoA C-acetyltransferase [Beijerinckiaceae bacterium]